MVLDAYRNGWGVQQPAKAKVYFRLMAEVAHERDLTKKVIANGYFLHGAAHCPDAKRNGIDRSFESWLPDKSLELSQKRASLLGKNIILQLRADLQELKNKKYSDWILAKTIANGGDQNSTFAATWDHYCRRVGLDKLEAAYPGFRINGLNLDHFYRDGHGNGGYTAKEVFYQLVSKSDIFKELIKELFGPLLKLHGSAGNMTNIGSGREVQDWPIYKAFLVRFGILNPN